MKFLALLLLPLFDFLSVFFIGVKNLGFFSSLLWLIIAAIVGFWLLRGVGMSAIFQAREILTKNTPINDYVVNQAIKALSAILLIFPGFISDILAVILLVPSVRTKVADFTLNYVKKLFNKTKQNNDGVVIDGSFERK